MRSIISPWMERDKGQSSQGHSRTKQHRQAGKDEEEDEDEDEEEKEEEEDEEEGTGTMGGKVGGKGEGRGGYTQVRQTITSPN